jgi:biopolymer transport protein ExbB
MEAHEFGQAVAATFEEYVLRGGLTMAFLIPLSIFTLGVTIQRLLDLRPSRVTPPGLVEAARAVKSYEEFHAFREGLADDACPLAQVLLGYIEAGERGEPVHPDINREPIEDSTERLYHSLMPLSTAYVIAPLLGVLGTTVAIMGTFKQFAIAGDRDMTALVTAIDQSLVSTMWGLLVAVPAYYCFALLQRRIYRYERDVLPALSREIVRTFAPYIRYGKDDLSFHRAEEQRSAPLPAEAGALRAS